MTRGLALLALALLCGCGSAVSVQVLAYSERFKVAEQESYVVLSAVLEDSEVWAYGEPAPVISRLAPRYRPVGTPDGVGASAAAPAPLDALLGRADGTLRGRGYRRAEAQEDPALVVAVAHSTAAGSTSRVSLHLGGEVDGVFRPDWISFALEVESGEEVDPEELLEALLEQVPRRGGEPPAD